MLLSETCQLAKQRKESIVSDDPASTSSKVSDATAQEGEETQYHAKSERMIMNKQPELIIRSLESQLLIKSSNKL